MNLVVVTRWPAPIKIVRIQRLSSCIKSGNSIPFESHMHEFLSFIFSYLQSLVHICRPPRETTPIGTPKLGPLRRAARAMRQDPFKLLLSGLPVDPVVNEMGMSCICTNAVTLLPSPDRQHTLCKIEKLLGCRALLGPRLITLGNALSWRRRYPPRSRPVRFRSGGRVRLSLRAGTRRGW
jgi:hypothetical protein